MGIALEGQNHQSCGDELDRSRQADLPRPRSRISSLDHRNSGTGHEFGQYDQASIRDGAAHDEPRPAVDQKPRSESDTVTETKKFEFPRTPSSSTESYLSLTKPCQPPLRKSRSERVINAFEGRLPAAGSWLRVWKWELLSSLLSFGSLLVIVAILAFHDGQPIPSWPRFVSINSLIAVFAAIFKGSLLMPVCECGLLWALHRYITD
jgi:hypothetical protein